jgi:hypothetical protein
VTSDSREDGEGVDRDFEHHDTSYAKVDVNIGDLSEGLYEFRIWAECSQAKKDHSECATSSGQEFCKSDAPEAIAWNHGRGQTLQVYIDYTIPAVNVGSTTPKANEEYIVGQEVNVVFTEPINCNAVDTNQLRKDIEVTVEIMNVESGDDPTLIEDGYFVKCKQDDGELVISFDLMQMDLSTWMGNGRNQIELTVGNYFDLTNTNRGNNWRKV